MKASASLAHAEAAGHIRKAMALVSALPEGPSRDEWELAFLTLDGPAHMALEGWDSPTAHATYERARLLAGRLGRMRDIFRSLWGLWMGAHSAGQHARAGPLLDEMYKLLEKTDEPEYVVQAHHAAGSQMHAEGKLQRAKYYTDQCLSAYRIDTHGNLAMTYGAHDPGCCSLGMAASALLMLGYPDQAHEASLKALSLGRQVGFQTGIAHTSRYRVALCIMLNEPGLAAESISEGIEVSEKFKLGPYLQPLALCDGWIRAFSGNVERRASPFRAGAGGDQGHSHREISIAHADRLCRPDQNGRGRHRGRVDAVCRCARARAGQRRAVLCRGDPAPDRRGVADAARPRSAPAPNAVSLRRLRSRAVRRRSSGSCAQPRHLPDFGPAKGDRPKHCRWWPRSMAGSPRGSIRSN